MQNWQCCVPIHVGLTIGALSLFGLWSLKTSVGDDTFHGETSALVVHLILCVRKSGLGKVGLCCKAGSVLFESWDDILFAKLNLRLLISYELCLRVNSIDW